MKSERPKDAIVKKKRLMFRLNRMATNIFNILYTGPLQYRALGQEQSLQLLLESRKSYIRLGNGESEILVGLDMATQVYSKGLRDALAEIIINYSPRANYLLGMTNWRLTRSVRELKSTPNQNAFRLWRFMRYVFWKYGMGEIDMPFLEADMFRLGDVRLGTDRIEGLWKEASHIIVVYNNEASYRRFSESQKGRKTYFFGIPDKNFFSMLPETQDRIIRLIEKEGMKKEDLVILASAGPGAKVLCYNLCQKDANYLCYDMGNFFHMHYGHAQR